jgi:hypothetical protein
LDSGNTFYVNGVVMWLEVCKDIYGRSPEAYDLPVVCDHICVDDVREYEQ